MTSVQTSIQQATAQLRDAGVDSTILDTRLLLQHALSCEHTDLIREPDRQLTEDENTIFQSLICRRSQREPLSHLIGHRDFWKDRFIVTSDTLDPRPDSETLIEAMLDARPNRTQNYQILDFGTGSGCLLLSLLREYPNAHGTAVDQSIAALTIAKRNAKTLKLAHRSFFIASNWGETLQTTYDMIITNPPYITEQEIAQLEPEVRDYEPFGALSGGPDGLAAYRHLLPHIRQCLKPDGLAIVEIGYGQADQLADLAMRAELNIIDMRCDLAGIVRALTLTHKR